MRRLWNRHVLPVLVDRACRSRSILAERTRWIPRATGEVLEVGAGSGLNFRFYDPARATTVIGLEPSAELRAKAAPRAADARVPISLVEGDAQGMPFDRGRFDSVVMTYTLCSIVEPARALFEIRRVLRPGGRLVFVEHGLSPDDRTARWQRRLTPLWRRVGGNCHLDRAIDRELATAGFVDEEVTTETADDVPRWLSYTYQGIARPA